MGSMASSTLVVNNLSEDVTKEDLEVLFSKEGHLDGVHFESSTRGIVKFHSSNEAKEAMDKLNETELKGKPMIITCCEKQCPSSNAKVWVSTNGPPPNNDDFKVLLSPFGAVDSFKLVLQHPGTSLWIVQFNSETSATNAINFFNTAEKYGMKFLVSKYNDCKKLCVKYHPKDLDENNIHLMFSMYGECTVNIEIKSSGVAFVDYHTSEGVEEAVRNLNCTDLGSHRLYIRGFVTQAVTEDNNPEEVRIFVIEDNRRQLVATVNMADFHTTSDFLQCLNKLGVDHRHVGLLERIRLYSPWPGYEVVYKHVDSLKEEVVINPFEVVEPCFNEDPYKHFELWFLSMVNQIEFYEKKAVPLVDA